MKRSFPLLLTAALVPITCAGAQRQVTPARITLGKAGAAYGPVLFPHRDHARMAEMGNGCTGCHHDEQPQSINACGTCHSAHRAREDLDTPDLRGAMHRQCFSCHHAWRTASACATCHTNRAPNLASGAAAAVPANEKPVLPATLVYETKAPEGRFVTFGHRRHANTFGLACAECHRRETCEACHGTPNTATRIVRAASHATERPTADEAHARCAACHAREACGACHAGRPAQDSAFDHRARTGWALNRFHRSLACQGCHPGPARPTRVSADCKSCHKEWQKTFVHAKAGIVLDDLHSGVDCVSCHSDKTFASPPACGECHTDKAWPADKPGKIVPGTVRKQE